MYECEPGIIGPAILSYFPDTILYVSYSLVMWCRQLTFFQSVYIIHAFRSIPSSALSLISPTSPTQLIDAFMAWKPCVPMVSLGNLCGMSLRLHWLQGSFMLPQHGGDFLTQPRRVALSRSLTKRSITATYQVVLNMYIVLSIIWNPNFSIVFCLICGMSCTNYYLLKRIMDIACGHVPITLLCLSLIIIWSGRIFCIESYLWILGVCVGVSLPTGVCMFVCLFWCIA